MKPDVRNALTSSARDFSEIVWPAIRDACGGGELVPVETVTDSGFANDLDTLAGIDAWQIRRPDGLMRGLASRVQWGKPYNTFSIRYALRSGGLTEYAKRRRAIEEGYLFPALTVQAYLSEKHGQLLSAAVADTRELYEYIAEHLKLRHQAVRVVQYGSNDFIAVSWDAYLAAGKWLATVGNPKKPESSIWDFDGAEFQAAWLAAEAK
jgi:hypothetical protein